MCVCVCVCGGLFWVKTFLGIPSVDFRGHVTTNAHGHAVLGNLASKVDKTPYLPMLPATRAALVAFFQHDVATLRQRFIDPQSIDAFWPDFSSFAEE